MWGHRKYYSILMLLWSSLKIDNLIVYTINSKATTKNKLSMGCTNTRCQTKQILKETEFPREKAENEEKKDQTG